MVLCTGFLLFDPMELRFPNETDERLGAWLTTLTRGTHWHKEVVVGRGLDSFSKSVVEALLCTQKASTFDSWQQLQEGLGTIPAWQAGKLLPASAGHTG